MLPTCTKWRRTIYFLVLPSAVSFHANRSVGINIGEHVCRASERFCSWVTTTDLVREFSIQPWENIQNQRSRAFQFFGIPTHSPFPICTQTVPLNTFLDIGPETVWEEIRHSFKFSQSSIPPLSFHWSCIIPKAALFFWFFVHWAREGSPFWHTEH